MTSIAQRKERFLRDSWTVRLGNLAANLARIKSFSKNPDNQAAVMDLVRESRYFSEWAAAGRTPEQLVLLRRLQRRLTRWMRTQSSWWQSPESRQELSREAGVWSQRIIAQSGLIPESSG